jgi:hypothetical protein
VVGEKTRKRGGRVKKLTREERQFQLTISHWTSARCRPLTMGKVAVQTFVSDTQDGVSQRTNALIIGATRCIVVSRCQMRRPLVTGRCVNLVW